jgi:hypothetical protein
MCGAEAMHHNRETPTPDQFEINPSIPASTRSQQ